jgi:putative FmdB family regulatory protein
MPIYEYHCKQCGGKFEKLVKLSTRTSEIECPQMRRTGRRKDRVAVWDSRRYSVG